ncbi:MAG: sigma-70 family RNA polymerase sigma factor [Bryobacteraceae bacterium]
MLPVMNGQAVDINEEYVSRLRRGVPMVREHFAIYFGEMVHIKLRGRIRSPELIEDVRQETLLRVLQTLAREDGLHNPNRLSSFVNSVCRYVTFEMLRSDVRMQPGIESLPEPPDDRIDLDAALMRDDLARCVRQLLAELPERDGDVLRMIFLEERDKAEVCNRMGISPQYLRVVLHRAKARLKEKLQDLPYRPMMCMPEST